VPSCSRSRFRFDVNAVLVDGVAHRAGCDRSSGAAPKVIRRLARRRGFPGEADRQLRPAGARVSVIGLVDCTRTPGLAPVAHTKLERFVLRPLVLCRKLFVNVLWAWR
jgi:hypothetical protein